MPRCFLFKLIGVQTKDTLSHCEAPDQINSVAYKYIRLMQLAWNKRQREQLF